MQVLLMISIILTVMSSAFLTLIFENKRVYLALCGFFAIGFAQVVGVLEILSVFSAICPKNILLANLLIFVLSALLWLKNKQKPDFSLEIKDEVRKLKIALKTDRWLKAVAVAFLIFLVGSLIYTFMVPAIDEDAFSYHVARLPFWYAVHNINHFEIADSRALVMPVNSEVFYLWAYSFTKSLLFVRLFSLLSAILFVAAFRGLLKFLNFSMKHSLWTLFSIFAMHNVMLSISGAETNISIAALMLSAVYVFALGVKENRTTCFYFAGLLFALAVGTKTPSLQAAPSLLLVTCTIAYLFGNKNVLKPIALCGGFFVLNFVLFGAYNYVQNYLDFGNFIASAQSCEMHKFVGGFQAFVANIIRYFARFIDFSGFPLSILPWRIVTGLSNILIAVLGISPDICLITPETEFFEIGNNFENMSGLGVLGFLVFLPSVVFALKKIKHSKRSLVLGIVAIGFLLNIAVLSVSLGYMIFSIRFLMFFVMFASPICVYSFVKKGVFRKVLAIIMIYMFTFSYYFYERRFSPYLVYTFLKYPSVSEFKTHSLCANLDLCDNSQACNWVSFVKKHSGKKDVLYFATSGTNIFYPKHSETDDFKVDFRLMETTDESDIDWNKYEFVLIPNIQDSTVIRDIQKYRNAVTDYNYENGKTPEYSYKTGLFAYCYYSSYRTKTDDDWMKISTDKLTHSHCYHNPEILKKHGFQLVAKFNDYDKNNEKMLNLYKKIR